MDNRETRNAEAVRQLAAECTLFLKRNEDFPLTEPCKIALFGSGARNTIKGGTGSGDVNSRVTVSIEEGLGNAGYEVVTKPWLDEYDAIKKANHEKFIAGIKKKAKKQHKLAVMVGMGAVEMEPEYEFEMNYEADAAVYVLSRISGEGNDRRNEKGDFRLTDTEIRDILKARDKYPKFMLVLNVGGPVDLTEVAEVENILLLSQLGAETGNILADIISGRSYPSGKLSTTWARYEDYPGKDDFGADQQTRYREGIYVGYRYFDTAGVKPMFPFGFGLGYTDFRTAVKEVMVNGDAVTVVAEVENTGAHPGKEVVQTYVSEPDGRLDKAYQKLCAFAKTEEIKPGESTEVIMNFRMKDQAAYDTENQCFVLEKGDYIIRVGNSSDNTETAAVIRVDDDIVTKKVHNCFGNIDFDEYSLKVEKIGQNESTDAFILRKEDIKTEKVNYELQEETDDFVEELSDEELAVSSVGSFSAGSIGLDMIGNSGKKVAGAAGETTSMLEGKGMPALVMADGPAGIRINKDYTLSKKGQVGVGSALPGDFMELLPPVALALMNPKLPFARKKTVLHHYATAIPIGTAVAQSFNIELAEKLGDIVGGEMEEFGIHLWLAPALNIHRNVLCGRNFEYYSEDPVLSGMMAAWITNGVQKHENRGVTVKHYAANNQETNRYGNSSEASERALREIYLKSFEVCLANSSPIALMTSYNLINGIHTCQHYGLIHDILRCEFGFRGLVMTDWIVRVMMSKKDPQPVNAGLIAKAGGDLVMPGSKTDFNEIIQALNKGILKRTQLRKNVTRVYRLARKMAG